MTEPPTLKLIFEAEVTVGVPAVVVLIASTTIPVESKYPTVLPNTLISILSSVLALKEVSPSISNINSLPFKSTAPANVAPDNAAYPLEAAAVVR